MITTTALLALLPLLTSALPAGSFQPNSTPINPGPFYVRASAPGTKIDQELVTASDNGFFIGKPTKAEPCPVSAGCGFPTNVTAININLGDGSASLDSDPSVTGGQPIYVGADYQLHFKSAGDHSNNTGDTYHGFGYQQATFGNTQGYQFTFLAPGEEGFYACPDGGDAGDLRVYATEGAECYPFKAEAMSFNQQPGQYAAYEYL